MNAIEKKLKKKGHSNPAEGIKVLEVYGPQQNPWLDKYLLSAVLTEVDDQKSEIDSQIGRFYGDFIGESLEKERPNLIRKLQSIERMARQGQDVRKAFEDFLESFDLAMSGRGHIYDLSEQLPIIYSAVKKAGIPWSG